MTDPSSLEEWIGKLTFSTMYLYEKQHMYLFSLCVSFYFISVTKLWGMIIRLCMCKGPMGHADSLHSKLHWLITTALDIILPVTVKSEN